MSNNQSESVTDVVERVVAKHGRDATYMVQILREVQEVMDWISPEVMDELQAALGVPRTKIEGVAGFYSFFYLEPRGRYRVLFSDNITDRMLGNRVLLDRMCSNLWVEQGKLSEDGLVSVDTTSCTGFCDQGPAVLVNNVAITHLTDERIDQICDLIREQVPVVDWPTEFFEYQDNIRRKDLILNSNIAPGEAIRAARARAMAPSAMSLGRGDHARAEVESLRMRALSPVECMPATHENPGGSVTLISEMRRSNLRGRGGAGFITGLKWEACHNAPLKPGQQRFVVCNADEGEPGTFKDRILLNAYADLVFEGMTVAALAIGARRGFLYLRGEYRHMKDHLEAVLSRRREQNLLGENILGVQGSEFDIEIHLGAGAYVCGEESALIESLEGKRGTPRNRPPFPVTHGYLDQPTIVNNVETYASAALIMIMGGEAYSRLGTPKSAGTKIHSISGDCERPGIYEYPFGVSIAEMLEDCGARNVQAVQIGGPSGVLLAPSEFDRRVGFEDVPTAGAFMVFNNGRDMFEVAKNFTHFFQHESCGFCTPCRVGTSLLTNLMDKLDSGHGSPYDFNEIEKMNQLLLSMSHCGLGRTACNPVLHTIAKFRHVFDKRLMSDDFVPAFDLDKALAVARQMTGRDDEGAHLKTMVSFGEH